MFLGWGRAMSKRQEKIAANQAEANAFLNERRTLQLAIFEQNFETGLKIYEANKDKLSEEEAAMLEVEIERNRTLIEKLKNDLNKAAEA
jgi:hypothetical protein